MVIGSAAARRGAPFGLLMVGPVVLAVVAVFLPPPPGHWEGHVVGAAVAVGQFLAVLVAAWWAGRALPGFGFLLVVVIGVGLVLEAAGNTLAGRAIWRTPWSDDTAGMVGSAYPGFVLGHDLAERGDLVVVLAGLVLAASLGVARRVPVPVAITATVLLAVPPWIMPAVSTVFLLAWLTVFPRREMRRRPAPHPM